MTNEKNILPFTAESIEKVAQVMIDQDIKGLEKYGQALDPMDEKYDWLEMTYEELADALKYLAAEARKKEVRTELLNGIKKVLEQQLKPNRQQIDVIQLEYCVSLVERILELK